MTNTPRGTRFRSEPPINCCFEDKQHDKTTNCLPCKHDLKRNVPIPNVKKRFELSQQYAVNCVFKDFQKKLNGRYLMVIPSGGRKTFAAVESVNRLFADGVLNPNKDQILRTAYRIKLLEQVNDAFTILITISKHFSTRAIFREVRRCD